MQARIKILVDPNSFLRTGYKLKTTSPGPPVLQYSSLGNALMLQTDVLQHGDTQTPCRVHMRVLNREGTLLKHSTIPLGRVGRLQLPLAGVTADWHKILVICEKEQP